MIRSLYTAASGMIAQQFNIDTISNNMANADTTGFKEVKPEFQDLLYLNIQEPTLSPTGISVGLGVKPAGQETDFSEGSLQETDNPLDVALNGPGFFTVSSDQGGVNKYYTRDGSFSLNANDNLVTSNGYFVLDENGTPIQISSSGSSSGSTTGPSTNTNSSNIFIGTDGTIGSQTLGIAEFANPEGLQRTGQNLYVVTAASGAPQTANSSSSSSSSPPEYTFKQNFLEASNVQVVQEMVNLITAQRAYELNSKAVTASDQMLQMANNMRAG